MDVLTRFAELFRARSDVWAEGYPSPDNPNKFRYVKVDAPLTVDDLRDHLQGDLTVGVYPLQPDSTVSWFAFDFDGDTFEHAFEQAKRQRDALEQAGLIAYIERSRSGLGCHVWGFLDEPVPAHVVRAALKPLVLSQFTFDRMYPVQDQLSTFRPLGNLIALPYSAQAVARQHSVFLEDDGTVLSLEQFLQQVVVNRAGILTALVPAVQPTPRADVELDPATAFRPTAPITGALKLISPYGCRFMRWAWQERRGLPEPAWYAALGQATVFQHGLQFAQLLSRDYPGYDPQAVADKFAQAAQHPPVGCAWIHEHFPEHACSGCPRTAPYKLAQRGVLDLAAQAGQPLVQVGSFAGDLERIERLQRGQLSSGLDWPLDGMHYTRFRRQELTIIGAMPSMGKTALLVHLALGLAHRGIPVFVFSAETGETSLRVRLLAHESGVDSRKLAGEVPLDPADWPRIAEAADRLAALPVYCDYTSLTADQVLEHVEAAVLQSQVPLDRDYVVFFDYLQFGAKLASDQSEYDRVTRLSTEFKFTAKVLDRPLVVFSQLKREAEGVEVPELTWFRSSGRIEQDLDVGMIITGERVQGERAPRRITIVKQREGMANVAVDYMLEQPNCRWHAHLGHQTRGSVLDT